MSKRFIRQLTIYEMTTKQLTETRALVAAEQRLALKNYEFETAREKKEILQAIDNLLNVSANAM